MNRENHDILMEQLLREILGGDRPRDMTERVLARAKAHDRARRAWWAGTVSAVAAVVALAVTLWVVAPRSYPEPQVMNGEVLAENARVERGSRLVTDEDQTARVGIGGYVTVDMEPLTAMTLAGSKFNEKVLLEQGEVNVSVVKNKGRFDVGVGPATVRVTGTKFKVGVSEEVLENKRVRRLRVAVQEGSVLVEGAGMLAGGERLAADSGLSEKTFEISSEPVKIERPRRVEPVATAPKVERPETVSAGGAEKMPEAAPATRRAAAAGVVKAVGEGNMPVRRLLPKPIQWIEQAGHVELVGVLRRPKDVWVLETDAARVLIYLQQTPLATTPGPGKYVRVVWENGKVVRIEVIQPATGPASRPARVETKPV